MNRQIHDVPSPNFNKRREGAGVDFLVLHYTEVPAQEVFDIFQNGTGDGDRGPVSAHYLIEENGRITQFVPESQRAWHAGVSYWKGITDINSHSIGVELENAGHPLDYPDYTESQISSLIELGTDIMRRHNIKPQNVLGHSDVAPGRKLDPGPSFPWYKLSRYGIGVWPDVTPEDASLAIEFLNFASARAVFMEHLIAYGYNPELDVEDLRQAFEAHYCPKSSNDEMSLTSLLALIRQAEEA